ncbi:PQQ-binding-like beta-propeller repeat protein [Catenovulum sp. SX2]|uniref:outer membrane protein assembly factor BamB family protein n=1 Tax=Catenovulum sp. SX2 TaxID=3398614 RepID=UPI003F849858
MQFKLLETKEKIKRVDYHQGKLAYIHWEHQIEVKGQLYQIEDNANLVGGRSLLTNRYDERLFIFDGEQEVEIEKFDYKSIGWSFSVQEYILSANITGSKLRKYAYIKNGQKIWEKELPIRFIDVCNNNNQICIINDSSNRQFAYFDNWQERWRYQAPEGTKVLFNTIVELEDKILCELMCKSPDDPSIVIALDKLTGEIIWTAKPDIGGGVVSGYDPVTKQLVSYVRVRNPDMSKCEALHTIDAETGAIELTITSDTPFNSFPGYSQPTQACADGYLYVPEKGKKGRILVVDLVTRQIVAEQAIKHRSSAFYKPEIYQGKVYLLDTRGVLRIYPALTR